MIKDIQPGAGSGLPSDHKAIYNGKVYFTAASSGDTFGLWVSDGTAAGTFPLAPPNAQSGQPFGAYGPNNLTLALNSLFFSAAYTAAGTELWRFQDASVPSAIAAVRGSGAAAWAVFPSPADGAFTIRAVSGGRQPAGWQLTDLAGRAVRQGRITEATTVVHYDLAPGLYHLRVQDGNRDTRMPVLLR